VLEYDAPLSGDAAADHALGQFDFSHGNYSGVNAESLHFPYGLAVDAAGNVFVADYLDNRVLEYDAPLSGDTTADHVFGKPNFTTSSSGDTSATSLFQPLDVSLDARGNIYVAVYGEARLLEFDWAIFKLWLPFVMR
jgi:hypothetical protein